jgi:hypothetical protein
MPLYASFEKRGYDSFMETDNHTDVYLRNKNGSQESMENALVKAEITVMMVPFGS